eukprot:365617-Chlamydomonas_euryale.AAC.15
MTARWPHASTLRHTWLRFLSERRTICQTIVRLRCGGRQARRALCRAGCACPPLRPAGMAAMAATSFESGHDGMVHDAQLDYYGRRLATCSSDKTIKVFDVVNDQHVHLADLRGHEGPVWQVAWAHPKFGSLLASCAFDHRVIVWKETMENQWSQVRSHLA